MRLLAIGDIHGCFEALSALEAFVPFRPDDRIITLGDYVDRGPDSCAVLDWLIRRHNQGTLTPLRGNHEIMMTDARLSPGDLERWLSYGDDTALASYSVLGDAGQLVDVPDSHWEFLDRSLRPYHEIDSHFFVHANAYPDYPLEDQPDYMLYWESLSSPQPHESGKIMVCGHTPQKSGNPLNVNSVICLDTWAYGRGWLTCLDVQSGKYWQANQVGETAKDGWTQDNAIECSLRLQYPLAQPLKDAFHSHQGLISLAKSSLPRPIGFHDRWEIHYRLSQLALVANGKNGFHDR